MLKRAALFVALLILSIQVVLLISIDRFGRENRAYAADVIIVLGAGLRPDGQPTETMIARARHGATLFHEGIAPVLLCSGGQTRQPFQSEAAACASILREAGVPAAVIHLEEMSQSTEENAIQSRQWMDAQGWRQALLVSSSYHLWRARWRFDRAGIIARTSPAPAGYLTPLQYGRAIMREVLAVNWQLAVDALGFSWTDFPP